MGSADISPASADVVQILEAILPDGSAVDHAASCEMFANDKAAELGTWQLHASAHSR